MPWLQMNSHKLWVSRGEQILGYSHLRSGRTPRNPQNVLKGHSGDVCRFVATQTFVVSGGRYILHKKMFFKCLKTAENFMYYQPLHIKYY